MELISFIGPGSFGAPRASISDLSARAAARRPQHRFIFATRHAGPTAAAVDEEQNLAREPPGNSRLRLLAMYGGPSSSVKLAPACGSPAPPAEGIKDHCKNVIHVWIPGWDSDWNRDLDDSAASAAHDPYPWRAKMTERERPGIAALLDHHTTISTALNRCPPRRAEVLNADHSGPGSTASAGAPRLETLGQVFHAPARTRRPVLRAWPAMGRRLPSPASHHISPDRDELSEPGWGAIKPLYYQPRSDAVRLEPKGRSSPANNEDQLDASNIKTVRLTTAPTPATACTGPAPVRQARRLVGVRELVYWAPRGTRHEGGAGLAPVRRRCSGR